MRLQSRVVSLVLIAATLSGCTNDKDVKYMPGTSPFGPLATPRDGLVCVGPTPWKFVWLQDADDLMVVFEGGAYCSGLFDHVELEYGRTRQMLTVYAGGLPLERDEACADVGRHHAVRIELEEPIPKPVIFDGATEAEGRIVTHTPGLEDLYP